MRLLRRLILLLGCLYIPYTLALEQHDKLWLGFNAQQYLTEDKKWLSFVFSQLRFVDENSHHLQTALIETGLGYQLIPSTNIWIGYRLMGHNPFNNFYNESRLFEQAIWHSQKDNLARLIIRTRFEEIARGNQSQIAVRLRERLALEIQKIYFNHLSPFLYDEVFLQINRTQYTAHRLLSENRLFLGFNFYTKKETWWEIGYINQYQFKTSQTSENEMSHILSITYNFFY